MWKMETETYQLLLVRLGSLQREARYRFHETKIFDEFLKLF